MSASGHRSLTPQTQHMSTSSRLGRTYSSYGFSSGLPGSSSFQGEASGSGGNASGSKQANPFVTNPHGHPSFNPTKLGSKGGGDSKTPKQPKPPDKPLMPYMRYSRKVSRLVWDSVKANNPDLKLWEIGKIIGQMWRELSDEEKQTYIDEYEADKIQYIEAMKVYHNSPAYQSWIAAKGKTDVDAEPEEPEKARRSKAPPPQPVESRVVPIQPTEEEDELDDGLSVKHVAAVRYQRNHCLINEIFSDAVVPDVRTIINETRMTVLKRQVHSLSLHQKKLESELQQIDDKHKAKKMKFAESSEQFYIELRNLCNSKPQITDEQFNVMIVKAKEDLREKQKISVQQEQGVQNQQPEQAKKPEDRTKETAPALVAEPEAPKSLDAFIPPAANQLPVSPAWIPTCGVPESDAEKPGRAELPASEAVLEMGLDKSPKVSVEVSQVDMDVIPQAPTEVPTEDVQRVDTKTPDLTTEMALMIDTEESQVTTESLQVKAGVDQSALETGRDAAVVLSEDAAQEEREVPQLEPEPPQLSASVPWTTEPPQVTLEQQYLSGGVPTPDGRDLREAMDEEPAKTPVLEQSVMMDVVQEQAQKPAGTADSPQRADLSLPKALPSDSTLRTSGQEAEATAPVSAEVKDTVAAADEMETDAGVQDSDIMDTN